VRSCVRRKQNPRSASFEIASAHHVIDEEISALWRFATDAYGAAADLLSITRTEGCTDTFH
jgi:hypothetical protein